MNSIQNLRMELSERVSQSKLNVKRTYPDCYLLNSIRIQCTSSAYISGHILYHISHAKFLIHF